MADIVVEGVPIRVYTDAESWTSSPVTVDATSAFSMNGEDITFDAAGDSVQSDLDIGNCEAGISFNELIVASLNCVAVVGHRMGYAADASTAQAGIVPIGVAGYAEGFEGPHNSLVTYSHRIYGKDTGVDCYSVSATRLVPSTFQSTDLPVFGCCPVGETEVRGRVQVTVEDGFTIVQDRLIEGGC